MLGRGLLGSVYGPGFNINWSRVDPVKQVTLVTRHYTKRAIGSLYFGQFLTRHERFCVQDFVFKIPKTEEYIRSGEVKECVPKL